MLVINAGTILTGNNLLPKTAHSIIIEGETISRIIPTSSVPEGIRKSAENLEWTDLTIMPGLIDAHSHLSLDAREPGHLFKMNDSECIQTIRSLNNMKDDLNAGITSLRALGDRYYIDVTIRKLIQENTVTGPDLQVCGIGMKGLHGHGFVGESFSGAEEFRRISRQNLSRGVDWLKIFITGGSPPVDSDFIPCFLTDEEIQTVVSEADAVGVKTTAHCVGGEGLRRGVKAGIHMLEHCYSATEEDAELLQKQGTKLCLTPGVFLDESREAFCPPDFVAKVHKTRDSVAHAMEILIAAGIPFALGSDAYHGNLYKELQIVSRLGADTKTALKSVTATAADILGMGGYKGKIEENYHADLIAVTGNPIADLNAVKNVKHVIKRGAVYK